MSDSCPHKQNCPMFPLFNLKATLRSWQVRYCDAEFVTCERYKRSTVGRPVPINLMPNGASLKVAKEL